MNKLFIIFAKKYLTIAENNMKFMLSRIFLTTLILIVLTGKASSQNQIYFSKKDKSEFTKLLSTIKVINFQNGDLILKSKDDSIFQISISTINKITFTGEKSSIPSIESQSNKITIFPSIIEDYFNIKFDNSSNEPLYLEILDSNGKVQYRKTIITLGNISSIDISDLQRGLYLCVIKTQKGIYCKKLIKK